MQSRPLRSTAKQAAVTFVPPIRRLVERNDRLVALNDRLVERNNRLVERTDRLVALHSDASERAEALALENARLRRALAGSERVAAGDTGDLRYLLIVAYGRSGSTLLQGLLNSIPGYLVRGENRQAVHRLFEFHQILVTEKGIHADDEVLGPQHAWYGIDEFPEPLSISSLRHVVLGTVLRPDGDTRVLGFKEIRWWQDEWEPYFDFLDRLFPGFRIIINTREHDDVARSKWWAHRDDPHEMLERYEQRLRLIEDRFGERAHRLHYDDWTADPDLLRGLYDWLGERFDRRTVEEVMAVRHSY